MYTAVLLTCYNRVDITLRCLTQFFAQRKPENMKFDVYLVDDASPDMTGDIVQSQFPQVNVIKGTGDLFWCKGMRLAWDTAVQSKIDYDFYLWLNDDIQFAPFAVRDIFRDYETILAKTGEPCLIVGAFAQTVNSKVATYGLWDGKGVVQPSGEPKSVEGCGMNGNLVLVPKAIYDVVGPIYGGYSHGFGDFDYRLMAKRKGFRAYSASNITGVCPRDTIQHKDTNPKSLMKRIYLLFSPKGRPLKDGIIYRYRNWGILRAMITACHVVILALKGEYDR